MKIMAFKGLLRRDRGGARHWKRLPALPSPMFAVSIGRGDLTSTPRHSPHSRRASLSFCLPNHHSVSPAIPLLPPFAIHNETAT